MRDMAASSCLILVQVLNNVIRTLNNFALPVLPSFTCWVWFSCFQPTGHRRAAVYPILLSFIRERGKNFMKTCLLNQGMKSHNPLCHQSELDWLPRLRLLTDHGVRDHHDIFTPILIHSWHLGKGLLSHLGSPLTPWTNPSFIRGKSVVARKNDYRCLPQ